MDDQKKEQAQPQATDNKQETTNDSQQTESRETTSKADIEKNKAMAILAYFIFFIPLLVAKDSKFAMYHANQGFLLLITSLGLYLAASIIPFIGFVLWPIVKVFIFILTIIGIINAAKGEMKPLPIIGGAKLL